MTHPIIEPIDEREFQRRYVHPNENFIKEPLQPPYNVLEVAYYILYQSNNCGDIINITKLNSILYYAQHKHILKKDIPLFKEDMVAFNFGVEIPIVNRKFSKFGQRIIIQEVLEEEFESLTEDTKEFVTNKMGDALTFMRKHDLVRTRGAYPYVFNPEKPNARHIIPVDLMRRHPFFLLKNKLDTPHAMLLSI